MGNNQLVKDFRSKALMTQRREMYAIAVPEACVAKLGEPPEVDELQTEVIGNAA